MYIKLKNYFDNYKNSYYFAKGINQSAIRLLAFLSGLWSARALNQPSRLAGFPLAYSAFQPFQPFQLFSSSWRSSMCCLISNLAWKTFHNFISRTKSIAHAIMIWPSSCLAAEWSVHHRPYRYCRIAPPTPPTPPAIWLYSTATQ